MSSLFQHNLEQHLELFRNLQSLDAVIKDAAVTIGECLGRGGKLLLCGNGGSAADSQHIAAEFTGRFIEDRRPLAAIALSTDSSALTCIANDYSFKQVFSRQVSALGRSGDCLLGISTSGNSENILLAIQAANQIGLHTIGLLGRDGGKIGPLCEWSIIVPSESTARIQEAHILIGHTICGSVEHALGLAPEHEILL